MCWVAGVVGFAFTNAGGHMILVYYEGLECCAIVFRFFGRAAELRSGALLCCRVECALHM